MSIIDEEWKEIIGTLNQNIVDLNKTLIEVSNINKELKQNNAEAQKQLNAQTKIVFKQDTPPQMQSNHGPSSKSTQQREDLQGQPEQQLEPNNTHVQYMAQEVHGDIQLSSQKYHTDPATSNRTVNPAEVTEQRIINCETIINDQKNFMARKKSQPLKKQPHEKVRDGNIAVTTRSGVSEEEVSSDISRIRAEEQIPGNANCTTIAHGDRIDNVGRLEIDYVNNLDLLCSVAMTRIFPDQQKRKANDIEDESYTEQNCSQEREGYQPHAKKAVATNGLRIPQSSKCQKVSNNEVAFISFGPNNTSIPQDFYESVDFTNGSLAPRKLLDICFDRETLATSSLTGRRSPAFKDKPLKNALDPKIIEDIVYAVTTRSGVSAKKVRAAITAKCADESKMWRKKQKELSKKKDKENAENYKF